MKVLKSLFLLLAFVASVFGQEPRVEKPRTYTMPSAPRYSGPVSVATWNLEWFPGGPGSRAKIARFAIANHTEAVAKILDAENPTIFIASEMHSLASAKSLNAALRRPYSYIAVTDYQAPNSRPKESDANKQEHALFSRIPWEEVWEVDFVGSLPVAEDRPARGYIGATFKIDGQTLTIFGVHPKANYIREGDSRPELTALQNVKRRERASRYLLEGIRSRSLDPLKDKIIIMGDFNTDVYAERFKGEKSMTMLQQAGFYNALDDLEPAQRVTIRAKTFEKWPDTVFDYILTSVGLGQFRATVVQRGTNPAEHGPGSPDYASDHYMLKLELPGLGQPKAPASQPPVVAADTEDVPAPTPPIPAPAPAPVAVQPEPQSVDFAQLAQTPKDWPREVRLTRAASFPVIINGKQYGSANLPPGTTVKLVRVLGENVRVSNSDATVDLPATSTDIEARVLALRRARNTPAR